MIVWAIGTVLALSLLILLVLAMRQPVAQLFGARWAYALWLLPLLRIAMPPLAWFGVDPSLATIVVRLDAIGAAAAPLPSHGQAGQWVPFLLALWAGGAACFLLFQHVAYRRFVRDVDAGARAAYPASHGGIAMVESRAVSGPLAIGLTAPRIVVPFDFLSRYSPDEQLLALDHERIHHRRGDLWLNCLALILLALLWWNPLAWIAFRAFRADQELSCDELVVRRLPSDQRRAYASALIKSASRPGLIAACPLNHVATLKRRMRMMKQHRVSNARGLGGFAALGGLVAAGLALSAPSYAQSEGAEKGGERRIIIREFGTDRLGKGSEIKVGKDDVLVGERALTERLQSCPEAQRLVSDVQAGQGSGQNRVRLVVCGKDGQQTPEMREKLLAALERARTEIGSGDLTPENRTKIVEALRREIERVRGRQ